MGCVWIPVIILGFTLPVVVTSDYRVMYDADGSPCEPVTPEIIYSSSQNTVILDDGLLENGETAWIGYVQDAVELQYIGCIRLGDIDSNHEEVTTSLDPGQCYSACRNEYTIIGLTAKGTACFCFNDDIKNLNGARDKCKTKCGSFACGSNNDASLYEKVDTSIRRDGSRLESCLALSYYGYNWRSCDTDLGGVHCVSENNDVYTVWFNWFSNKNWYDGTTECFKSDEYPLPYRESESVDWANDRWTGVIQTMAIRTISDFDGISSQPYLMFGYVEKSKENYLLKFTNDTSMTRSAICIAGIGETSSTKTAIRTSTKTTSTITTEPTSKTTETTITLPETPSSTGKSSSTARTSTSSTIVTASTSNTSSTESALDQRALSQESKESGESNVGLFVGLPIAVLVVIGIGVVVFIVWRKRNTTEEKGTPSKLQNNIVYHNNNGIMGDSVSIGSPPPSTNNQPDTYDLARDMDGDNQYINVNSNEALTIEQNETEYSEVSATGFQKGYAAENAYFVLEKEDGVSHKAGSTNVKPISQARHNADGHLYNTAAHGPSNDDNDEYDHIGKNDKPRLKDGNLYDTTFARKPMDDTYDSTGHTAAKLANKVTDNMYASSANFVEKVSDGTYDSTKNSSASTNKQDGLYDKANYNNH